MYGINKEHFGSGGHVQKKHYEDLSHFDQVLAYIKNWDKSHNYKYCVGAGQVRTRLLSNYLRKIKGFHNVPKLEEQMEIIFQNFDDFKKHLNAKEKDGTLHEWL